MAWKLNGRQAKFCNSREIHSMISIIEACSRKWQDVGMQHAKRFSHQPKFVPAGCICHETVILRGYSRNDTRCCLSVSSSVASGDVARMRK